GNAIRILNSGSYPITSSIKGCQFNNISSIGDSSGLGGSAIYMESKHGSQLIIEESCQFYKCIIDKGNGGAIYIDIDFSSEFLFKINDTLIQECIAKENTSSSSPTGYGGGIFLTGNGDYDPSSKRLDLKGMKIYGNFAEIAGQSLYVAMTKIAEWCQTGILGEYAKGNYSDRSSNFEDIEEDGSSEPILVQGDPQSQQTASFGVKDVSWMDYNNKHYGIFISNDRRIFTGVGGKQDEAYPLEIIIDEDNVVQQQQYQFAASVIVGESIKSRKLLKSTIILNPTFKTLKAKQK
ncbi:MAG: hypothetical protein EZS28_023555, partial [Streblomastix strix]